jgi:hypothetical protein
MKLMTRGEILELMAEQIARYVVAWSSAAED